MEFTLIADTSQGNTSVKLKIHHSTGNRCNNLKQGRIPSFAKNVMSLKHTRTRLLNQTMELTYITDWDLPLTRMRHSFRKSLSAFHGITMPFCEKLTKNDIFRLR